MSIRKEERDITLTGREVCRIISMREQVDFDDVQAVFSCLADLIDMACSDGYNLSLPNSIGKICLKKTTFFRKGTEKRLPEKIGKSALEKNDTGDEMKEFYQKKDGTYWVRFLKDPPPSYTPILRFSRALRDRIKESVRKIDKN